MPTSKQDNPDSENHPTVTVKVTVKVALARDEKSIQQIKEEILTEYQKNGWDTTKIEKMGQ